MPCLAAMLAASAATAQPGGSERLVSSALPGFVTGYAAANAQQSIKEEIPRSETVQAWTRMVTTQRYGGLARQATVSQYAGNVRAGGTAPAGLAWGQQFLAATVFCGAADRTPACRR